MTHSQIFKHDLSLNVLYDFLDNICEVKDNEYIFKNSSYKKVTLMGHSYGGILVANVLKHWNADTPIEVHVVASPLLGMPMLTKICGYEPITMLPKN